MKPLQMNDVKNKIISVKSIEWFSKDFRKNLGGIAYYIIKIKYRDREDAIELYYNKPSTRSFDHKKLVNATENKGAFNMKAIKSYFEKHQEAIITIAIVVLVDNYIFEGKLRERISTLLEKMLGTAEKRLTTGGE